MQKRLLVVESNTTGTGLLALHKARTLGLAPLFLTNRPQRYKALERVTCPVLVCDTNSTSKLMQTIATYLRADEILGITTTSEFYLETVAQLAAAYTLPGNAPGAIRACRDKAQTRLRLEEAQVKQPRFKIARSSTEISGALASISPPYLVKPADDTGSNEVRLCQTAEEAREQAMRILGMDTNVRGQRTAQTALVEEFLDAPEFSVEMFAWQGTMTCIGITEKRLTGFPYFVEHGHIFPANLPQDVADEMQMTVRHALEAVNVTHGATHTEVKLTPQGCAIIEINARLAGGMIPELIRYARGIDLLEQQLKAAVGEPPDLHGHGTGHAGIHFLVSHAEGILKGIQGMNAARKVRGVEQATMTALLGARVARPRSAYDRLGYVIVQADTYKEVVLQLKEALEKLEVLLEPSYSMRWKGTTGV